MYKRTGKILGILLSASILISGICMIMQCLNIYNSGDKPYSREAVAEAFNLISVPIYICIALIAITFIYNLFIDVPWKEYPDTNNNLYIIKAISRKKDIHKTDLPQLKKTRKTRVILSIILIVLYVIGFVCFLCYAMNPSNFHQSKINASMIKAMIVFCSCISIPFVYSIIYVYLIDRTRKREIDVIRPLLKDIPSTEIKNNYSKSSVYIYIKVAALIISSAILIYGLISGGTADVLTKAINICTECIGLG